MTDTNKVDIQTAVIQMQARTINSLYTLLSQHNFENEPPGELKEVIKLQKETVDTLINKLKKYITAETLNSLECMRENNIASGLILAVERSEKHD